MKAYGWNKRFNCKRTVDTFVVVFKKKSLPLINLFPIKTGLIVNQMKNYSEASLIWTPLIWNIHLYGDLFENNSHS